jgi:AraC family transcriptional regulator
MLIRNERIRPNRPYELQLHPESPPTLACLSGREPDAAVGVGAGFCTLWLCLRGALQLELPDGVLNLAARQFYVSAGDQPLRGIGGGGSWIALALPRERLRNELRGSDTADEPSGFFPAVLRIDRPLLRAVARVLRAATASDSMSDWYRASLVRDYLRRLVEAQRSLEPLLQRCPGKTAEQRRQALQRLLRARQRVDLEHDAPTSVAQMAAIAHYSTCHFMRVFQQVFGESPYDFMLQTRMRRAQSLLRRPNLAITEIAGRLGFSSGATFARVFKAFFGETASQARQRLAPPARRRDGRDHFGRRIRPHRANRSESPGPQIEIGLASLLFDRIDGLPVPGQ